MGSIVISSDKFISSNLQHNQFNDYLQSISITEIFLWPSFSVCSVLFSSYYFSIQMSVFYIPLFLPLPRPSSNSNSMNFNFSIWLTSPTVTAELPMLLPTNSESAASLSKGAPVSMLISVLSDTSIARYFLLSPMTMQLERATIAA